jgi:hypothetical protein
MLRGVSVQRWPKSLIAAITEGEEKITSVEASLNVDHSKQTHACDRQQQHQQKH